MLSSGAVVAAALQLLVGGSHHHPLAAADKHGGQPAATQLKRSRSAPARLSQLDTDTLWVSWLRWGFGRGAGASSAGFLYHMDWLKAQACQCCL